MNKNKIKIPKHYIYLFVSIVFSIMILYGCFKLYNDAERHIHQSEAAFKKSKTDYFNSLALLKQYFEYYPFIQSLYDDNVLGQEDRLSWIENLQSIAFEHYIPTIQYQINVAEDLSLTENNTGKPTEQSSANAAFSSDEEINDASVPTQPLTIKKSLMTLSFDMAHESDLFSLLYLMEEKTKAFPIIESCMIENKKINIIKANKEGKRTEFSLMGGECKLSWYTLNINKEALLGLSGDNGT